MAAVCLSCGGGALTMLVASDPHWVGQHIWLLYALRAGFVLCGAASVLSSKWVGRLRQRLRGNRPALSQETRGANSPATTVGSIGNIGSGAQVNIGGTGGILQITEDPAEYPRVELGCTHTNTVPHIDQLCALYNRGADALNIRIQPIETENYILGSTKPLDRILRGGSASMAFTGTPKRSELPVATGVAALMMIIRDICSLPHEQEVHLTIQLVCSDMLQQHHYVTTQELSYDTFGNRVCALEYKGVRRID